MRVNWSSEPSGSSSSRTLRMIDEGARQGDALGHAAGELVRVGVGERFEADEAHEVVDLVATRARRTPRDQAGLDVAAHRQPGEQVGVLEHQAALGAGADDRIVAQQQLAGVG